MIWIVMSVYKKTVGKVSTFKLEIKMKQNNNEISAEPPAKNIYLTNILKFKLNFFI